MHKMLKKYRLISKKYQVKTAQDNPAITQQELPLFDLPAYKYRARLMSNGPNPVYDMYSTMSRPYLADPLFWILSRAYNLPDLGRIKEFTNLYFNTLSPDVLISPSLDAPSGIRGTSTAKIPQPQVGQAPITHYLWWSLDPVFMGIHSAIQKGEELSGIPEQVKDSYLARFAVDTASLSTTMMLSHYSWRLLDQAFLRSPISNTYIFYRTLGGVATPLLLGYDLLIHTPITAREQVLNMARLNSPLKVYKFDPSNPLPRFSLFYLSNWDDISIASFILGREFTETSVNINDFGQFRRHSEQLARMLKGIYDLHRISLDFSEAPPQYQQMAMVAAADLDGLLSGELAWRLGLNNNAAKDLLSFRQDFFPTNFRPNALREYWQRTSDHLNSIASDLTLVSVINYASNLGELLFGGSSKDPLAQHYYEKFLLHHNSRLFSLQKMAAETLTSTGVSTPVGTAYLTLSQPMWKHGGIKIDMSVLPDLLEYYNKSGKSNGIFSRNLSMHFDSSYKMAILLYFPVFSDAEKTATAATIIMNEIFGEEAGPALNPISRHSGITIGNILKRIRDTTGLEDRSLSAKEIELLEKAALITMISDIFNVTTPMSSTISVHTLRRAIYSKAISSSDRINMGSYGSGKNIMDIAFNAMKQELSNAQIFKDPQNVIGQVDKVLGHGEGFDDQLKKSILFSISPDVVSRWYIQLITADLLFADKNKLIKYGFSPNDAEQVSSMLSKYRGLALRNPEYLSFALEAVGDILGSKDTNGWSLLERILYFHYRSLYYELGKRVEADPEFLNRPGDEIMEDILKLNKGLTYQYFTQPDNHLSVHRKEFFRHFNKSFLKFLPIKLEVAPQSEQEINSLKMLPVSGPRHYFGYMKFSFAVALHDCIEKIVPTLIKQGNVSLLSRKSYIFPGLNYFDCLYFDKKLHKFGAVPAWLAYFMWEAVKAVGMSAAMLLASYGVSTVVQSYTEMQLRNRGIDHYRNIEPIFQLHPQYNVFTPQVKNRIFDCVYERLARSKSE
jgi:hypothetical protein